VLSVLLVVACLTSLAPCAARAAFPYTTLFRSPEVRRWLSQVGAHADDLLVLLPAPRSLLPKVVESIREQGAGSGEQDQQVVCVRSEEHTPQLQSRFYLVCRTLLGKRKPYIELT